MSVLHIKNGTVLDPGHEAAQSQDLWVVDGLIRRNAPEGDSSQWTIVDAKGKIVAPGLIDLAVNFGEPGHEGRETIASGTRAAAVGGFTSVVTMPGTDPIIDSQTGIKFILSRSQTDAIVNVFPAAATTRNLEGRELTEFGDLIKAGAVALTDNGHPVADSNILRRALEYSSMFEVPMLVHCEDASLAGSGVVREGKISVRTGLQGWTPVAETIQVARAAELADFTGGRVHIQHISTARTIQVIRAAKLRGVNITAEVTPHHLALTEDAVLSYGTNFKTRPPLPSIEHQELLIAALLDGTIDSIATHHSPHTDIAKDMLFPDAPFGCVGLETALAVLHSTLVETGRVPLDTIIEKLTAAPARILGMNTGENQRGCLAEGAAGDLVIFDPECTWTVEPEKLTGKSKNTAWAGAELKGRVWTTIVAGEIVHQSESS